MLEYKLPLESFIGAWYIDPKICDGLINVFNNNTDRHNTGVIGGPYNVDKNNKDSVDLGLHPDYTDPAFMEYKKSLKDCTKLYEEKYPELSNFQQYGMNEGANIQYYKPGGGYFAEHCERTSKNENRCLVWMTYLTDTPDAGTNFKYQNITTPCKKGLTVIWPTDFTHTHSGQISKTHEKYIITGWFGYIKTLWEDDPRSMKKDPTTGKEYQGYNYND